MSAEIPLPSGDPIAISEFTGAQSVASHFHRFIELVFIMEGGCRHTYLGRTALLTAGDAFIIVPGQSHAYEIDARTVIVNCIFTADFLGEDWNALRRLGGFYHFVVLEPLLRFDLNGEQILRLSPPLLSHVRGQLNLIDRECRGRAEGYLYAAKAHLLSLLLLLGRVWEQVHAGPVPGRYRRELVEKAVLHIHEHLSEPLTIPGLASLIPLHPDYFRRIFREVTGVTPVAYINRLRVEKAKELLRKTGLPVARVAEAVGMEPRSFSRIFRQTEGIGPLTFRKTGL